ncbi:hypothetical protein [Coxiella endosymbiont of Amblyomma nuttalli]|uniref:hypothetical protein n=1 Tax=Coxiella endosymbiont of Amblyomma nuttalli TaxID=2749996 RepID=UPI0035101710
MCDSGVMVKPSYLESMSMEFKKIPISFCTWINFVIIERTYILFVIPASKKCWETIVLTT